MKLHTYTTVGLVTAGITLVVFVVPAVAQYVEPSSVPPGGRSASFLDTSVTTQQKLGSLLIGDQFGTDQLCLNGTSGADCISSWLDLTGSLGGPYLKLYDAATQIASPEVISQYDSLQQLGYVGLTGNGSVTGATITTIADPSVGTKVGVYASDAGDQANYAARFSGDLLITNHANVTSDPGEICLNATVPYTMCSGGSNPGTSCPLGTECLGGGSCIKEPNGQGCIAAWSDLGSVSITDQVRVQLTNPPFDGGTTAYQNGSVWLGSGSGETGALQVDSAVAGGISQNFYVFRQHCGDGLCSTELFENLPSHPLFCPADCS